jgi:integrase
LGCEGRAWHLARRAQNRKTPRPASRPPSRAKANPKRAAGDRYTNHSYAHAIQRACERAGVPVWSPNQLRHNAATRIRAAYGIEAARIILGHSSAVTSEIYAEIDREKAKEIVAKIG